MRRLWIPLLLWPAWATAAERLSLDIGRIEGAGWSASDLHAEIGADGGIEARVGHASGPILPTKLSSASANCRLDQAGGAWRCRGGQLALDAPQLGRAQGGFELEFREATDWRLRLSRFGGELSGQDKSESYVAEKLGFSLETDLRLHGGLLRGDTRLELKSGQGYADPVFADFSAHPLSATASWTLQPRTRLLTLQKLQLQQDGIGRLQGNASLSLRQPKTSAAAMLLAEDLVLAPVAELYLKPFLVGTRMASVAADGRARGRLEIRQGAPVAIELHLNAARLQLGKPDLGFERLAGELRWSATAPAAPSALRWSALRFGKLKSGAAHMRFTTSARDFSLSEPLHLGLLDGALNVRQLQLRQFGQPGMSATFDADIEPIELAQLCRAFGWPEFSGTLSGRLPGLKLKNEVLTLDGALTAKAFDGNITIGGLRVIQPFSVLPRMAADIRLRNLDLKSLTSAFSFGRIEGRLHGDVTGLRLLGWRPVAMNARLYTPPGDRSRHRISQRAIDSISRAGGGPSGALQRSFLRVFKDFGYERIGWNCRLDNGVCEMGGIEPAKNGGYVLVQGRLLPRIDVVGYSRRVGWETFLGQLKAAMDAEKAEIR